MANIINREAGSKKTMFRDYLLNRNPSEKFIRTYFVYLHSSIVKSACNKVANTEDIFAIAEKAKLTAIYLNVKKQDRNIASHNVYSGAISAYIKFLEGKALRPMLKSQGR